jgi:Uncharacterised nucleotidyltransferase
VNSSSDSPSFSLESGVALAQAVVAYLSVRAGIRSLAIKGLISNAYGLRPDRVPADADVLIDPSRFDDFCAVLESCGWRERIGRPTPSLLPVHSRTYIHTGWPCDIDVHWMFPGFFADPARAFEALWVTRSSMSIAHQEVVVPSLPGAAVIAELHALRNLRSLRHASERTHVESIVRGLSRKDQEEFYRIAREGGAVWVLRELLGSLRLGALAEDASIDQQRRWNLNSTFAEEGSTLGWWLQFRATRWRARPGLLARALWVPRAEISRNDSEAMPSVLESWRFQRQRWARGMRAAAHYIFSRSR